MIIPIFLLGQKRGIGIISKNAARIVALASFFGWSVGSILWVITIKNMGATVASVLGSTSPLFAVGLSILVLKERVTWKSGIGTLLVVCGVWLVILGL
jgi:drug/metabolite transporter (DMT)-like permease